MGRPPTRNTKSLTALGEIPVEMLSDMGSTPIISTTTRPGIRNVFRVFVFVENSFLCDMELYRLMRLGFLQCIFCCFFPENQVYYRCMYGTDRKRRLSEGSVKK